MLSLGSMWWTVSEDGEGLALVSSALGFEADLAVIGEKGVVGDGGLEGRLGGCRGDRRGGGLR